MPAPLEPPSPANPNKSSEPTEPQRFGVVGLLVVESHWLVIRRSESVQAPGHFCFPGGGIEEGETEPQALIRELDEELGVRVQPIQRLWASCTDWGVHLTWWHAELIDSVERIAPNPDEVAEVRWLTPDEISALPMLLSSNHDFLSAWRAGAFQLPH